MVQTTPRKIVLTKECIEEIKRKLDTMEGKEVDEGPLVTLGVEELSDEALRGVAGGWAYPGGTG